MDTKTPPIPLKQQEKRNIKRERSTGGGEDLFLPPLAAGGGSRQRSNSDRRNLGHDWADEAPHVARDRDHQARRPRRVLNFGATQLMHACQQGDRLSVLRLLRDNRESLYFRDRTLRNALHYCMEAGCGGAVAAAAPELVNAPDAEGHTPLHLAVINGDSQLIAVLLANGADYNARDKEGHSVLHWAIVCGDVECVRLILSAGARPSTPDFRGGSPLHYAAQCCGAAAARGQLAVSRRRGLQVLHLLLEYGADVNARDEDGRQPILWAASAGSVDAILALARAGGSAAAGATDKDGLTALHCAASRGHARCIEALVNFCGSQPDYVDDNGCSALHYAATLGHAEATALLLRLGADPNRQDRKGRTPVLCAAAKGQLETLKILVQHGASLHARSLRGTGVAHEAVMSGRTELIEWLARKKPKTLDVATYDGRTPLHLAALNDFIGTCKVLLDHGVKINTVFMTSTGEPMTALDAALCRGNRDCAKLIQMHGGMTALHLRSHRTGPNRVFAAKVKIKHPNSTSQSDTDSPRHRQKSNVYIEEHWIEKRTRKHSNSRKPSSRRDSRSFSEEEIRLSKTRRDRRRRAKSESSRYEGTETEEKQKKIRRRRSKHEYSESSSDYDSPSPSTPEKRRPETPENLSDDSLEVVVVRRSVEKKSEKIHYSDKKTKQPRETSRETRVLETERRSSRKKLKEAEESQKQSDAAKRKQEAKNLDKGKTKKDPTDSTSQEAVERVTVTAIVHKDQPPDTPEVDSKTQSENELKKKSKIEEILEKADDMQTALMSKVEDLRRGVESVRRQANEELPHGGGDEEPGEEVDDSGGSQLNSSGRSESGSPGKKSAERLNLSKESKKSSKSSKSEGSERPGEAVSMEAERKKHSSANEGSMSGRQSELSERTVDQGIQDSGDEEEVDDSGGSQLSTSGRSESGSPGKKSAERSNLSRESKKSSKSSKSEGSERLGEAVSMEAEGKKHSSANEGSKSGRQSELSERTLDQGIQDSGDEEEVDDSGTSQLSSSESDSPGKKSAERSNLSRESKKSSKSSKSEGSERSESRKSKSSEKLDKSKGPGQSKSPTISRKSDSPARSSKSGKSEALPSPGKTEKSVREEASGKSITAIPKKSDDAMPPKSENSTSSKSPDKATLLESSADRSPDRSAIVAVIDSPEWDEEDEEVAKEIQKVVGEGTESEPDGEEEEEDDDDLGMLRVLPSTSEEETPRRPVRVLRGAHLNNLPRIERRMIGSPSRRLGVLSKQRKDSGGRDSGIEPSPRVSKIPKRTPKCCPNTEKQQALNMKTIQRDVQISLRRFHMERKIFFQLMELKRLQIRHGRANEHILVKRQVDTFNKAGMSGPILGVVKYDQALTFKDFETFLYEQLRRLQRRPASPNFCTEAKQCIRKTHRCHHATSAYTSVPIYTYLDGEGHREREASLLPRIESRGKGQMTVEVTKGDEKQVISLPAESLDRTKKYFITFTVRGEAQGSADEVLANRHNAQRNTKSV